MSNEEENTKSPEKAEQSESEDVVSRIEYLECEMKELRNLLETKTSQLSFDGMIALSPHFQKLSQDCAKLMKMPSGSASTSLLSEKTFDEIVMLLRKDMFGSSDRKRKREGPDSEMKTPVSKSGDFPRPPGRGKKDSEWDSSTGKWVKH